MARKFLYFVAAIVTLVIAGAFALRIWADELTALALVPTSQFEAPPPLAANVYQDPAMWISRPGLGAKDPARWLPTGAPTDTPALPAAVFFIHPTSYLEKSHWNAPLDDAKSRGYAEAMTRAEASPFNASVDLWAPRYRQAAFGAFLTDAPDARQALDLAYSDVLQAFDYFVASVDKDRPIVLAGHSQGALHLKRLLADRAAGKPLAARIAAAYIVGWPVSLEHDLPATSLPACATPDQAGCIASWLSYAEPADPATMIEAYARAPALDGKLPGGSPFLCSNPLTGGTGGSAPASANLGTLVPDAKLESGVLTKALASASCAADGTLRIGPAPELGPFVLPGNNYHVYDIPLFWANLRADVARRVAAWKPAR